MINSRTSRLMATSALTALALGGLALGATNASASTIGSLAFTPHTGSTISSDSITTSGACTDPSATNIQAKIYGAGFPTAGQTVVANIGLANVTSSPSGGYILPLADTLQGIGNLVNPPVTYQTGKYDFVAFCRTNGSAASLGDFTGSLWFTSSTAFQDIDPATSPAVPTTTSLTAAPASPSQEGTVVTLGAAVSPAGYPGTVTFEDGSTTIGSPVAVNTTTGLASLQTSFGVTNHATTNHALTAVFTPSIQGLASSTSSALNYSVTPAPATDTTTTLAISPASNTATQYDNVSLTATVVKGAPPVTPTVNPPGAVQFTDNGANIGSPVSLSGGTATLTQVFSSGTHSFAAAFIPADAAVYNASSATSVQYIVGTFAGVTGSETVTTTVAPGALTISVAQPPSVILPTPQLNTAGSLFTTSGAIKDVTVTDTRAGNPGWALSGQISDFASSSSSINGGNLGWVPALTDSAAAQTVVPGATVAPGNGLAIGAAVPAGVGLTTARSLATAALGHGNGTAHVGATLNLNVPTSTPAGTYLATLTLTAI